MADPEVAVPNRRLVSLAGVVATFVGLAAAELAAGLLVTVPSPLDALGQQVVALAPGGFLTTAIEILGPANRAVLLGSSLLVAVGLGVLLGRLAAGRFVVAVALVGGVAVAALAASLTSPDAALPTVLLALVAASWATLGSLRLLLARLGAPVAATSAGTDGPDGRRGGPTATAAVDRRRFLRLTGVLGASAALAGTLGRTTFGFAGAAAPDVTLPEPASTLPPIRGDLAAELPEVTPLLTPVDDFFRIDAAIALPRVDPADWRLRIHGLVDRELEFTYQDLLDRDLVEVDATISCVSNEVGGDLVGTARWLGVPLVELLDEAGPTARAEQVVGRSVDGWTGGFPLEVATDGREALVAVAMNDVPLPVRHGFPARLVVPGLYGYVSATKWLQDIELTTWDGFDGYWVPRGWSKQGPVKTMTRIDLPASGDRVEDADLVVAGVAWAPVRGIGQVEIQVDDGPWEPVEVLPPLSEATWVQWRGTVALPPGDHTIAARAVDAHGEPQPEGPAPPAPDGAEGWHSVRVEVA